MARNTSQREGYSKLLDFWSTPKDAGDPIGCVASTFTFEPIFFEEDCLSRFLKIESDPDDDGPVFLIEREEKMSSVQCISVLVDQHHCKGKRSLRWDMIAARIPKGIMHAKISVLYWSNYFRVIIASANLTKEGYRINQEVFGVLDFYEGSDAPLPLLKNILDFLKEIVAKSNTSPDQPEVQRWNNFLDNVEKNTRTWGRAEPYYGGKYIRVYPLLISSGRPDLFEQLKSFWKETYAGPPTDAYITSPFYDPPESANLPAEKIWKILNQKGPAYVCYQVRVEHPAGIEKTIIHAPESLRELAPIHRSDVQVEFSKIQETFEDKNEGFRPLHMKTIWMENDDWLIYVVGSSNFTTSGTGVGTAVNYEANLAYIVSRSQNPDAEKKLKKAFLFGEICEVNNDVIWEPPRNEDEPTLEENLVLHSFFGCAYYFCDNKNLTFVKFTFRPLSVPDSFAIYSEDDDKLIYSKNQWIEERKFTEKIIPWKLPLPPSGFHVTWNEHTGYAWWPVNVENAAVLPPPPELKDIPLEVLITILTSARPLHQVLGAWIKKNQSSGNAPSVHIDPHKKVDTTKFLFQRTRQISWALNSLREKLQRPFYTLESLQWRLRGPVGVLALAHAIIKEGKSENEKAFLVAEIARELLHIVPSQDERSLKSEIVKETFKQLIQELKDTVLLPISVSDELIKKYVTKVLEGSLT